MLRASRNIWLREPYPNKMLVPALPCSPLPRLAPDPNQTFPLRPFNLCPESNPNHARLSPVFCPSPLPCLPLVPLPVQSTGSSGSSSTELPVQ
ncbi:Hypothetical protein SMAX5B_013473 [Scophthalmus maximus]|uniref:Uncharacterized protein n=1 Tax=Scophthalmus maximus TaxID=52904 RepID=A0A2U9B586_SCOMX|nr:Hypothetical protein SMAX5B_013473 [Scophthalmus maximus]